MWNQILRTVPAFTFSQNGSKKKALVGGLPSTIHSESQELVFQSLVCWDHYSSWTVGTGFVEDPVSRPTGSYKFAYLVPTPGRDARNMVSPFIYHFGWVENPSVGCFNPKKKTMRLPHFSWWNMVKSNPDGWFNRIKPRCFCCLTPLYTRTDLDHVAARSR